MPPTRSAKSNTTGASLGFEAKLWLSRRQAPKQHGRGGIQARRPRPHLPQMNLRHLRRTPREIDCARAHAPRVLGAAPRPIPYKRLCRDESRGQERIPRRQCVLGASGCPLAESLSLNQRWSMAALSFAATGLRRSMRSVLVERRARRMWGIHHATRRRMTMGAHRR